MWDKSAALAIKNDKGVNDMDMLAEHEAKQRLLARLDESLLTHAKNLAAEDNLQIADVYWLQGLAGTHRYLKNVHPLNSAEVDTLLRFDDPLAAANHCRELNPHRDSFPICALLQETGAWNLFDLAKPEPVKPLSLMQQLDAAIKAVREAAVPVDRSKGGEAR